MEFSFLADFQICSAYIDCRKRVPAEARINVPGSALEIEKVFTGAGLPQDVFKSLLIDSRTAMEIIDEDLVDGISLTGSVRAGSEIGELAGRTIKPFVLELGGSDPFIVLEDADIDRAAEVGVRAVSSIQGKAALLPRGSL